MGLEGAHITTVTDSTQTRRRDPVIDGLKLVAAGGIVMVHIAMSAHPGALRDFLEQVAYCALYFFFLVAGYFHGALGTRGPAWLGKRFVRLAVPYVVWSVVYLLWWEGFHYLTHQPFFIPNLVRTVFFAGANEVLWSLPWLFACAVFAELFARTPFQRRALLVATGVITLAVWFLVPNSALPDYGIRQFIEGGRWLFVYVAGMELRAAAKVPFGPRTWMALGIGSALAAGTLAVFTHAQPTALTAQIVMTVLCGTAAFSMLAATRVNATWFGVASLAWGGEFLLGIYVSHHLWLDILARLIPSHQSWPAVLWIPFAWTVCFTAAVLVTKLLLAHRWTRLAVS
ncbi:MAG: acyltransferase [Coriobacteriia bacterium]|nr:acyltransferase [Coriobacteriia bacterium]